MYENQVSGFRGSIPPAPHTGPGETSPLRVSPPRVREKERKYRMKATGSTQQGLSHSFPEVVLYSTLN